MFQRKREKIYIFDKSRNVKTAPSLARKYGINEPSVGETRKKQLLNR